MAKLAKGVPKKPYAAPVLTVYGTVRELTQANQAGGKLDAAKSGFRRRTAL
jgi:hypothetical protein